MELSRLADNARYVSSCALALYLHDPGADVSIDENEYGVDDDASLPELQTNNNVPECAFQLTDKQKALLCMNVHPLDEDDNHGT